MDEVVWYQKEIPESHCNVVLTSADGSKLPLLEMEYDGNTERGIARKNVVLYRSKSRPLKQKRFITINSLHCIFQHWRDDLQ